MYNHNFVIGIMCHKSHIKNAKCAQYNFYHFNPISPEQKNKEIAKITSFLASVIAQYKKWNSTELNVSFNIRLTRQEEYINANGELHQKDCDIYVNRPRYTYHSIEAFIKEVLNVMKIADPTILISQKELFENPSIKYLINRWYHE